MIKTVIAAAVVSFVVALPVHAAEQAKSKATPSAAQMAQRQKMKDCNAKAKADALSGAKRKSFMKLCLSKAGHAQAMAGAAGVSAKAAVSDKRTAQRQKMKDCNAKAKADALSGAKRKAFMKQCLSKS